MARHQAPQVLARAAERRWWALLPAGLVSKAERSCVLVGTPVRTDGVARLVANALSWRPVARGGRWRHKRRSMAWGIAFFSRYAAAASMLPRASLSAGWTFRRREATQAACLSTRSWRGRGFRRSRRERSGAGLAVAGSGAGVAGEAAALLASAQASADVCWGKPSRVGWPKDCRARSGRESPAWCPRRPGRCRGAPRRLRGRSIGRACFGRGGDDFREVGEAVTAGVFVARHVRASQQRQRVDIEVSGGSVGFVELPRSRPLAPGHGESDKPMPRARMICHCWEARGAPSSRHGSW